jgi:hypothetical protein
MVPAGLLHTYSSSDAYQVNINSILYPSLTVASLRLVTGIGLTQAGGLKIASLAGGERIFKKLQ